MTQRVDPPIEPYADTDSWFESSPQPIIDDPALATLIVQLGMATNALSAQHRAALSARGRARAIKNADQICSLAISAALVREAMRLIHGGLGVLRPLVQRFGADDTRDLLQRIGQLCAGNHPACEFLNRARNELAFHWDDETVGPSVRAYESNTRLIWIESAAKR